MDWLESSLQHDNQVTGLETDDTFQLRYKPLIFLSSTAEPRTFNTASELGSEMMNISAANYTPSCNTLLLNKTQNIIFQAINLKENSTPDHVSLLNICVIWYNKVDDKDMNFNMTISSYQAG